MHRPSTLSELADAVVTVATIEAEPPTPALRGMLAAARRVLDREHNLECALRLNHSIDRARAQRRDALAAFRDSLRYRDVRPWFAVFGIVW